ncbi:hypothetical protein TD95_002502 [Thielaviopsis punctulata]|uniref:SGT1-like protein n=1 Tax=Thielaviopsis punctulata TaxID=72032 RepID=A0A0F4ZGE4_9PEZI|nr:hypothetical protein TD95_002502 [Thielaviopsis punctulata]
MATPTAPPSFIATAAAASTEAAGLDTDRLLPENTCEYHIFVIGRQVTVRQQLARLEAVRKEAVRLCTDLTREHIWQKDEFHVDIRQETGLVYLHGTTDYGDSVDDEWLIVFILRQISLSFPDIWIRVSDCDGEFLLVEAASAVPSWLNPEIDRFRIWLHRGQLFILPPDDVSLDNGDDAARRSRISKEGRQQVLTLPKAVQSLVDIVGNASTSNAPTTATANDSLYTGLFRLDALEQEAFYRLSKYPGQIEHMLHYSLVTIPRKLAYILHECPKALAPAIEEFYLRDPISLKPILQAVPSSSSDNKLIFPPIDLITTSVKFTKVLFAQLRTQRFDPPMLWEQSFASARNTAESASEKRTAAKAHERLELGMKLTTGFEILARKAAKSDRRLVREVAILLEDVEEDGEDALPTAEEIRKWPNSRREDSDAWLDIDFTDFERELAGRSAKVDATTKDAGSGFGDANAQENLRKIVSRFETFLNDEGAGIDGINVDGKNEMDYDDEDMSGSEGGPVKPNQEDSDGEDGSDGDEDVDFDEAAFADMMKQVLGLAGSSLSMQPPAAKSKTSAATKETSDEADLREAFHLMNQMEAELKGHGALALDDAAAAGGSTKRKEKRAKQIAAVTGEPSRTITQKAAEENEEQEEAGEEEEVDIDFNLAKNLLESFKSQGGMAGPTGNLLGLMGFQLPRDEGSDDEDEYAGKGKGTGKA